MTCNVYFSAFCYQLNIYFLSTTTGSQLIYVMVKTPFFLWSSLFFQRLRPTSHKPVKRSKHIKYPKKGYQRSNTNKPCPSNKTVVVIRTVLFNSLSNFFDKKFRYSSFKLEPSTTIEIVSDSIPFA